MKIDESTVVTLSYQLFVNEDDKQHLMDQRDRNDPVEFVYGHELLLPKVEEAIFGQTVGFKTELVLVPEDGFGDHRPEMEQWVDRDKFPKDIDLLVGMKFQTQGDNGEVVSAMIKEIKEDQVLLDANHPLAGFVVHFQLEILRVREATEEEITSGEIRKQFH